MLSILTSVLVGLFAYMVVFAANAAGLFQPYVVFSIAESAEAVSVGDFNHDGRNDAAVSTSEGNLLIYTQNVSNGLNSPVTYTAGSRPESLAVGDLNNDGWDDLVVTNFSSSTISVFLQQANGTLANRVTYTTNSGPDSVAVGDVNNDGLDDVVVSHWTAGNIGVFIQNINGTLDAKIAYTSPTAGYDDIAIGDVNGDGLNDVVKMNGQGLNPDLSIYLQNGSGTLNAAVSYSLPGNGILGGGIGIGDLTGDGKQDIAMSYGGNIPSAFVAVFVQGQDGTLQSPVSYSSYDIPKPVEVVDVNLDGLADIVTLHSGWQRE
ncbi:MAG: VCBS repeat-containing protein [Anaerolineales bacterium]|uniref:FG-GAP repeat domain-containing protein n=1 Tax=Candidatus Villigracilis proximus TaxID=3140683 RepID=UPI0031358FA4|nr:VCBS repeat-containing protein [Anaerolineales bacterium]